MKSIVTTILFFGVILIVHSQSLTSLSDGLGFINNNEILYWAKKNKVKKLKITVPGYFLSNYLSSVYFEYDFDSIDYHLKRYRVFFEEDKSYKGNCFSGWNETVPNKDSLSLRKNDRLRGIYNLNNNNIDIYGEAYQFYIDKTGKNFVYKYVEDGKGDTVSQEWLFGGGVIYFNTLALDYKFDKENNIKQLIEPRYSGGGHNRVFLKEWNSLYDTTTYASIDKIDKNSYNIHTWVGDLIPEYKGEVLTDVNYAKSIKTKKFELNWKFKHIDTIGIATFIDQMESYVLSEKIDKYFSKDKLLSLFDRVIVYRNPFIKKDFAKEMDYLISWNSLDTIEIKKEAIKDNELRLISKDRTISISEKYTPCFVETEIKNKKRIERYYLPKDSTFKEKGNIVMQLTFDNEGNLLEKIYNQNVNEYPSRQWFDWQKVDYEYDSGMLIKKIEKIQKSDKDLRQRKNPQRIRYRFWEENDYTLQNRIIVNPNDKYDVKIENYLDKYSHFEGCDGKVTAKIEYY